MNIIITEAPQASYITGSVLNMNLIITETHNSMDHVLLYKPQVKSHTVT